MFKQDKHNRQNLIEMCIIFFFLILFIARFSVRVAGHQLKIHATLHGLPAPPSFAWEEFQAIPSKILHVIRLSRFTLSN